MAAEEDPSSPASAFSTMIPAVHPSLGSHDSSAHDIHDCLEEASHVATHRHASMRLHPRQ